MKLMNYFSLCLFLLNSIAFALPSTEPIVTAQKYMEYKRKNGHLQEWTSPKIVLVCYQQSTLQHLLECSPNIKLSNSFSNLYVTHDGSVGLLGRWGIGAPALAIKMEELIALGVTKFIAVGTAGSLMARNQIGDFIIAKSALAEDGVAHLYLKNQNCAHPDEKLFFLWKTFSQKHLLPHFHSAGAWSYSAIFRETPADVLRVTQLGYDVVEMEAATLYAIGKEKQVQTLSLFVISDILTQDAWIPHIKEPKVRKNLHQLSEWALEFCKEEAKIVST